MSSKPNGIKGGEKGMPVAVEAPTGAEVVAESRVTPENFRADKLRERVNDIEAQREKAIQELREAHEYHQNEANSIKDMLEEMGESADDEEVSPPVVHVARTTGGQGSGARGNNTHTIKEAIEALARKYKAGLSRPEYTEKMISEMNYQSRSGPESFVQSVYTGGLQPLMNNGTLIPVGPQKARKYKHKDHCTQEELAQAKK